MATGQARAGRLVGRTVQSVSRNGDGSIRLVLVGESGVTVIRIPGNDAAPTTGNDGHKNGGQP